MATQMVTLRGKWSRTNTTRRDVYAYRRTMRKDVARLGGTFDATLPRAQPERGTLTGTYRVTLPIVPGAGYRNTRRKARHVFEALMLHCMCRPPRITVDWSNVRTRYDVIAPQGIL